MRALICDEFGHLPDAIRVADWPAPPIPGPGEVLIDVAYASVSHATGLMIEGRYQTRPPRPFSPGTEAVGHVRAIGPGVRRLRPGQAVVAIADWGCHAEQVCAREATVYPVPEGLPLLQALPVPLSYGTAYTALVWRARLQPGDTVLVLGAGAGVGLAAVEIASRLGAEVIACASTPAKREAALARGARHAIDPDIDLAAQVKAITQGRGADIVLDPVGGALAERAVRAAAANAHLLSIGFASGQLPALPANLLLVKNLTLHGVFFGRYIGWTPQDEREAHAPALQRVMQTLLGWARDGHLRPTVSKIFAFHELPAALTALESRQVVGKVALAVGPDSRPA